MTDRPSDIDVWRRQLRFRSWHRGIREMDLIMGQFADTHLAGMDAAELEAYEALLEVPDTKLYGWISGRETPPAEEQTPLLKRVQALDYMKPA